jgi:hypothetical protein
MSTEKNYLTALWATVEEKARLMDAAVLLLSPEPDGWKYLRPIIALACTLTICLLPVVSAGEEVYTAISKLAW